MRVKIYIKDREVIIDDLEKCGLIKKITGLMFKRREKANALLFDFRESTKIGIHSLFVFFPFLAIWLDNENNVVGHKIVYPFVSFTAPDREFSKLIEIPLNKKYEKIFSALQE